MQSLLCPEGSNLESTRRKGGREGPTEDSPDRKGDGLLYPPPQNRLFVAGGNLRTLALGSCTSTCK